MRMSLKTPSLSKIDEEKVTSSDQFSQCLPTSSFKGRYKRPPSNPPKNLSTAIHLGGSVSKSYQTKDYRLLSKKSSGSSFSAALVRNSMVAGKGSSCYHFVPQKVYLSDYKFVEIMPANDSLICPICRRGSNSRFYIPHKSSSTDRSWRDVAASVFSIFRRFYSIWTTLLAIWVVALILITDIQCYAKSRQLKQHNYTLGQFAPFINSTSQGSNSTLYALESSDRNSLFGTLQKEVEVESRMIVQVYYEPLCPDSKNFIRHQLAPTMEKIGDRIELVLVPYGKAKTFDNGGTLSFQCQHGPTECLGNKVHSCVVKHVPDTALQTKIVSCMIADNYKPKTIAQKCLGKFAPDKYPPIQQCYTSREGDLLLQHMGSITDSLNPSLSFVPTVTLDGSQADMFQVLGNLQTAICKKLKGSLPSACKHEK